MAADVDAAEINVLTDAWRGPQPTGTSGSWAPEERAAAADRLRARGWLAGEEITDAGRDARDRIELATDAQEAPLVDALGSDATELLDLLTPSACAVVS